MSAAPVWAAACCGLAPGSDPSHVLIWDQMFCLVPPGPLLSDSWDRKPPGLWDSASEQLSSSSVSSERPYMEFRSLSGEEMM